MLAAHLITIDPLVWTDPATWPGIVQGRSSILFATLAGVSIGIVTGGRTPLDGRADVDGAASARRARIHPVGAGRAAHRDGSAGPRDPAGVRDPVPPRDPLHRLPGAHALRDRGRPGSRDAVPRGLHRHSSAVGRRRGRIPRSSRRLALPVRVVDHVRRGGSCRRACRAASARASRWRSRVGGAALTLVAAVLDTLTGAQTDAEPSTVWDAVWTGGAHSGGILEVVGSGGFALAMLGVCLLLCRTFAVWIVLPLRAVGSMPLTAYAGQILVWARGRHGGARSTRAGCSPSAIWIPSPRSPSGRSSHAPSGRSPWDEVRSSGPPTCITRFMVPAGESGRDVARG